MKHPTLDLSMLPEEHRRKLQAQLQRLPPTLRDRIDVQLAKLPPEQLAAFVEQGSPMLDKLLARVDKGASAVAGRSPPGPKPTSGHYNKTVQAGDSNKPLVGLLLAMAVLLAILYTAGLLPG